MPRIPRNYLETTFFHIMSQGLNKNFIFENPMDKKYYIDVMYKLKEEHGVNIIAYCIMDNHTHLLLETGNLQELSKYMQRLNTKYGKYYNKKYSRVGYVFRDRYKSEGIYSERQLYSCIKYIYNNPVKAGICSQAEQYQYSNCKFIEREMTEEYHFIDIDGDKNKICKKVIKDFLKKNKLELIRLKKEKSKLKQLIIILKDEYNISFRMISSEIKINMETIRKIYNNC